MEYNSTKENINFTQILYDAGAEQSIDTQINLPEYCRDVERILKCAVVPNIFACQTAGDRVTADGEAVIRIIYVSDKGSIECYEQSVPFSKYAEVHDLNSECSAMATATGEYVNCRAVSPRRLSVNGNVNIRFTVTSLSQTAVTVSADGCGLQMKNETLNADIPVAQCKKMFEIGETVALEQNNAPVSSIIRADAFSTIESVKCIANKMLIKGEMCVDILYRGDDESNLPIHIKHNMPLSQIVELAGVDENSLCDCTVKVSGVNTNTKTDSNGENRLIDLIVKAFICVEAYENKDVLLVTDSYSTEYEVKTCFKNIELLKHIHTYSENKNIRTTVDMSGLDVSEISDVCCRKVEGNANLNGDKIDGKGNSVIGILYKDSSGEYGYAERTVDFAFDCPTNQTDGTITAEPNFTVADVLGSSIGADKAEVRMSINIYMPILLRTQIRVCTELSPDETKPKSQNTSTLTVYFASSGENVWDIARTYNTTVEAIKEENEISQDTISEKMMLMIPKV